MTTPPSFASQNPPSLTRGGFFLAYAEDLQKCYSFFFFCVIMVKILAKGEHYGTYHKTVWHKK